MTEVQQVWNAARAELRQLVNEDVYDRWFAGILPLSLSGDVCRLGVSNDMFSEWLANNYGDLLAETLTKVTGRSYRIAFESGHELVLSATTEAEAKPAKSGAARSGDLAAAKPSAPPAKSAAAAGDSVYHSRFTFDTFVIGDSNKFSHAAAVAVAKAPGRAYNPLFIHGGTGLGKTHLLQAIAHDMLSRRKRVRIEYLSSEEFSNIYIDAIRDRELPKFRNHYRNVDLLLIDDVHFFEGKERLQEEFFHTFNALYNAHKQIVLTSDRPPHELGGLEKRLVSRFEWGLTTEVHPPDLETRLAILRKKQADHAVKLDDAIMDFVATRIKSNIRRLEGALIRLVSYASMTGAHIDQTIAEQLLRPLLDEESTAIVTIERIQKVVAEHFDIRLADMTSKRRPQNIAMPRQVAMFLARKLTDQSLPSIGDSFNRNHATILHAIDAVNRRMDADASLRDSVGRLERLLAK